MSRSISPVNEQCQFRSAFDIWMEGLTEDRLREEAASALANDHVRFDELLGHLCEFTFSDSGIKLSSTDHLPALVTDWPCDFRHCHVLLFMENFGNEKTLEAFERLANVLPFPMVSSVGLKCVIIHQLL